VALSYFPLTFTPLRLHIFKRTLDYYCPDPIVGETIERESRLLLSPPLSNRDVWLIEEWGARRPGCDRQSFDRAQGRCDKEPDARLRIALRLPHDADPYRAPR